MKQFKQRLACVSLFLFTLGISAHAKLIVSDTAFKDSLCSYTWNSAINDCPDVLGCIYPGDWQDTIINVPENITRISEEGLKLCLEDLQLQGSAEIVYIMDLSGSMKLTGDPSSKRPDALLAGFKFQRDSSSDKSRAAYVGFNNPLVPGHLLPLTLVRPGWPQLMKMVDTLKAWCNGPQNGATNYQLPLDKAIEFFNDPSFIHDTVKAIIFISDGNPDPATNCATPAQIQALITKKIPVYGIFLGSSIGLGLDTICQRTNGKSYLVPPNATDTLAKVVKNIVKTLIKPFVGKSLTVTNTTNGSSANAVSFSKLGDTAWAVKLDKSVYLNKGDNRMAVTSVFGTIDNTQDTTLAFQFTIRVGGQSPTQECYYCWYRSKILVYDASNKKVDTLSWKDLLYTVQLRYFGPDSAKLPSVNILVRTIKGDSEYLTLPKFTHDGQAEIYSKTVPFQVLLETVPAIKNNGTTEANFQDLITFFYRHPSDKYDTATAKVVVSAPPDSLKIFDKPGDPLTVSMLQYNKNNKIDTVTAGKYAELYAKVFAKVKWLEDYEKNPALGNKIKWTIVDNATQQQDLSIATLTSDSGNHNRLFPRKAYKTVKVTAKLQISSGALTINLEKAIILYIQPGDPRQLVIEPTNDFNKAKKNEVDNWSPIEILGNSTTITAYAILRDSLGNWVRPARAATWYSESLEVVSVSPGPSDSGIITKGSLDEGITLIHAKEIFEDTAIVITQNWVPIDLRVVRIHNQDTAHIENLVMYTDNDTTLYVQVKRSDNLQWVLFNGKWGIDTPVTSTTPPVSSKSWSFSPTLPHKGILWSSCPGFSDTVQYEFLPSGPSLIKFRIITADSLLIAGQKIQGEVSIFNKDGLIPGIWKYPKDPGGIGGNNPAQYSDILDNGLVKKQYVPYGTTDTPDSSLFSYMGSLYATLLKQVYRGGIDTLSFVLYNAPPSKTPHKLTVNLDGVTASTDPFVLKPGPLDTIVLSINNTIVSPKDTQFLTINSSPFIVKAKGYDKFGNFLPEEKFKWQSDPSLIDFKINALSDQIYFDPSKATISQKGKVIVSGVDHPNVTNHVVMVITGPNSLLMRALTRDQSGNGILDGIELFFDRPFKLPADINNPANLSQIDVVNKSPDFRFKVIKVDSVPYTDNKNVLFSLDQSDSSRPQTAWTPLLTLNAPILSDSVGTVKDFKCDDGAGPVVWEVVKTVNDVNDLSKDVVKVTLSENFYNVDNSSFLSKGPVPEKVFFVWTLKENKKDFQPADSMLYSIPKFDKQENDWTTFTMSNKKDLNELHWVNLQWIGGYVADKSKNIPNENNKRVRVMVLGKNKITIAPIPLIPTVINPIKTDKLLPNDPNKIFNLVNTNGGCMITVTIKIDLDDQGKPLGTLTGVLLVFDVASNLVYKIDNQYNILESPFVTTGGSTKILCFYWDGTTNSGMKSAVGLYRMVMHLTYRGPRTSSKTNAAETVAVGMRK